MAENPSNIVPDQIILLEGGSKLVPAPSAGDSGKVLGVLDSDGDIGWTEGASSSDVFVAKYGVTPYSEIAAAIVDGKDVVCMYVDSNNVTYTYTMTQHDADNQFVRFAWLKKNNDRTISSQSDSWYEITMQGTTWHNVSGPFPANLAFQADGSTTQATRDQNIVQFSVKNPLPASTSADADKVLTVNSSGNPEWATAQGGGASYTAGEGIEISNQNEISADIDTDTLKFFQPTVTTPYAVDIDSTTETSVPADIKTALMSSGRVDIHIPAQTYRTFDSVMDSAIYVCVADGNGAYNLYTSTALNYEYDYDYEQQREVFWLSEQTVTLYGPVTNWTAGASSQGTLSDIGYLCFKGQSYMDASNEQSFEAVVSTPYSQLTYTLYGLGHEEIAVKNPLPASTSSDVDKVLAVNNGGAPYWKSVAGAPTGDFVANMERSGTATVRPGGAAVTLPSNTKLSAISINDATFDYQTISGGNNPVLNINLYNSGSLAYTLQSYPLENYYKSASGSQSYTNWHVTIKKSWLYFPTPLSEYATYTVKAEVANATSVTGNSYGTCFITAYKPSTTSTIVIPNVVTTKGALSQTNCPVKTTSSYANQAFATTAIEIITDTDKGIVQKWNDNSDRKRTELTIYNSDTVYSTNGQGRASNNYDVAVALQNGSTGRFPIPRWFKKQGYGTSERMFYFYFDRELRGGDVLVIHAEFPATATTAQNCPCYCYFKISELVQDWESGTDTHYYYPVVLPGLYVANNNSVVIDGVCTIPNSHESGQFGHYPYTTPTIVSIDSTNTVTVDQTGSADNWNICISRI